MSEHERPKFHVNPALLEAMRKISRTQVLSPATREAVQKIAGTQVLSPATREAMRALAGSSEFREILHAARAATGVSEAIEIQATEILSDLGRDLPDTPLPQPETTEEIERAVDETVEAAVRAVEPHDADVARLLIVWWVYAVFFLIVLEQVILHPEVAGLVGAATGVHCHSVATWCRRRAEEAYDRLLPPVANPLPPDDEADSGELRVPTEHASGCADRECASGRV